MNHTLRKSVLTVSAAMVLGTIVLHAKNTVEPRGTNLLAAEADAQEKIARALAAAQAS